MTLRFENVKMVLFMIFRILIILIFTAFLSFANQNEKTIIIGKEIPDLDVYRIDIVKAKSLENAKIIGHKLNKLTNKPIYINYSEEKFLVQVGGFISLEEANKIISILQKKGIKNLSVNEKKEYKQKVIMGELGGEKKIIYVKKVNSSIKIDGVLNEPEWKSAIPVGDFIQQEPFDGNPATEKTEAKIIRNGENIYFGIICYDSEPDKIVSNEMRRDAQLFNNDNIEIFIDSFNDKKNCYYFRTNPSSARYDAMITDEGKNINYDWNTIWNCSSRKTDKGWVTEIAIPFHAIRFKEGLDRWGVNFGREIRRKNERTFWSYIPRGLGTFGKYRVSLCGDMIGLKDLTKGENLEIIPYANANRNTYYSPNQISSNLNGGIDVLYRITGNLRADFSYNTDFAQVEADQEIVNVSRFNVFFPEKRDFFLENAGLFQFGDVIFSENPTGRAGSRITSSGSSEEIGYQLYYSRKIGLKENEEEDESEEIPLYGGTKIAGKIGKSSLGIMSMQTKEKSFENEIEPTTNYSIMRLKQDLFRNSNIGMMFLNKQNSSEKYNRGFGIDGNFPLTTFFTMGGSVAKTSTPHLKGEDYAGTLFMDLNTDAFSWNLKYLNLGDNFNPEMGFIKREKIRNTYTTATFRKWINKYGIRNIRFFTSFNYITNNDNVLETRRVSGAVYTNLSSGHIFGYGIYRYSEFLDEIDTINDTLLVPIGNYNYDTHSFFLSTDHGRIFSVGIDYKFGDYYGGVKRTFSPHYHFRPSSHLSIDHFYDYNHVVLPTGYFYSNVLSARITYMFNPDFYVKTYIQWNDFDKRLSTNILFHFIQNSTNNFYIVYNENRNPDVPGLGLRDRVLMAKFVYHLFI